LLKKRNSFIVVLAAETSYTKKENGKQHEKQISVRYAERDPAELYPPSEHPP